MNYIKLEINGKEYGAKIGTLFLKSICEKKEISLPNFLGSLETEPLIFLAPEIIYHAIKFNADIAKKELDLTENQIYDWIDTVGVNSSEIKDFMETLVNSLKVHSPQEEGNAKPQKKAVVKK